MTPEHEAALAAMVVDYKADRSERLSVARQLAPFVCRYCNSYWRPVAGTLLDGHAACVVSDEFKTRLAAVMRWHPEFGYHVVSAALGVSYATVRAWYNWDERRRSPQWGR